LIAEGFVFLSFFLMAATESGEEKLMRLLEAGNEDDALEMIEDGKVDINYVDSVSLYFISFFLNDFVLTYFYLFLVWCNSFNACLLL
jgi:hypothetical protein